MHTLAGVGLVNTRAYARWWCTPSRVTYSTDSHVAPPRYTRVFLRRAPFTSAQWPERPWPCRWGGPVLCGTIYRALNQRATEQPTTSGGSFVPYSFAYVQGGCAEIRPWEIQSGHSYVSPGRTSRRAARLMININRNLTSLDPHRFGHFPRRNRYMPVERSSLERNQKWQVH